MEVAALAQYETERTKAIRDKLGPEGRLTAEVTGRLESIDKQYASKLPQGGDKDAVAKVLVIAADKAKGMEVENWGLLGAIGLNE